MFLPCLLLRAGSGHVNLDLFHFREGLLRVLHELADRFATVSVIDHLGQELRWNSYDVRPSQRCILDIDDSAYAANDDMRR